MDGLTPNYCGLGRVNILEATYACLERLRTDRIEVMQFHSFDETTPIEESLMAVEDLIAQNLIRYLGVSNFSVDQLKKYAPCNNIFRRARIQSVQNQFDILYGEDQASKGVLGYCAANKLSFIAWSPLRGGLLSDRYLNRSKVKPGDRLVDENLLDKELTKPIVKKLTRLANLAREWGITLTQLTVAYMLHIPAMGPVIAGCSMSSQVAENAKAGRIKLEPLQLALIKKALKKSL